MYLVNTFTDERYYLFWDFTNRLYKVCNIETGQVVYWSSADLQSALEFGHFEKACP